MTAQHRAGVAPMRKDDKLADAAHALVQKLHAIHADPKYQGVWSVAQIHQGPYSGPQYVDELAALESALSEWAVDELQHEGEALDGE